MNEPMLRDLAHCIEIKECGVWETVDVVYSLEDALMVASSLCRGRSEDRVRISTPDNRIL